MKNTGRKIKFAGMGKRIRRWREDQGMKAYELARRLNISNGSLSEIENGKTLPSALTLASIHQNTNLNVGYVLTGQSVSNKPGNKVPRVLMVEVDDDIDLMILKNKKKA